MNQSPEIASIRADLTKMARLVTAQVSAAVECAHSLNLVEAEEIIERDDVVDNLNVFLEGRCFDLVATGRLNEYELRLMRATTRVVLNLERSGDAAAHIAKRVRLIRQEEIVPVPFDYADIEQVAVDGLGEAIRAFFEQDLDLARRACLREPELDTYYVARLKELRSRMQAKSSDVPYLLSCFSIMKYLEKIADFTLNVGEQTIYLITGRRLKFSQYQELDRLVGANQVSPVAFQPYWDGISGAVVARVDGQTSAIFKEGSRRKIQAEAEKLEAWERISGG